eukprot:scaffold245763_cov31-Tisochrysis_lutea.AAC.3
MDAVSTAAGVMAIGSQLVPSIRHTLPRESDGGARTHQPCARARSFIATTWAAWGSETCASQARAL